MYKIAGTLLVGAVCALSLSRAGATVSALYQFTSNTGVSSDTDTNSTAGLFTFSSGYGPGTTFTGGAVHFPGGGADLGVANESTAISDGRYSSFHVDFASQIDLVTLSFSLASGTSGQAINWALLSSVGGFTSADNIATGSTSSTTASTQTATFAGASFEDLSSVTFELVLWNGFTTPGGPNATLDNVTLDTSPSASSVPEPGVAALTMAGLVAVCYRLLTLRKNAARRADV